MAIELLATIPKIEPQIKENLKQSEQADMLFVYEKLFQVGKIIELCQI